MPTYNTNIYSSLLDPNNSSQTNDSTESPDPYGDKGDPNLLSRDNFSSRINREPKPYGPFKQGYRLKEGDLHHTFFHDEVAYPYSGLAYKYSPYWVRYELGIRQESNNSYFPLGSLFRIPIVVATGVYRPNFIIGSDWNTGKYVIRWKFKKSAYSDIEYIDVEFRVVTEGIQDYSEEIQGGFLDLPADLNVKDPEETYQDFTATINVVD